MTQEEEEKIIDALKDLRWDYRTIDGIARDTKLTPEQVKSFLESRKDIVWKSSIPDKLGRDLFTLNERVSQSKEFFRNLTTFMTKRSE